MKNFSDTSLLNKKILITLVTSVSILSAGCVSSDNPRLTVGDCFEIPSEGTLTRVKSMDCNAKPNAQLYAEFESEEDNFSSVVPGNQQTRTELECNNLLKDLVEDENSLPEDFRIFITFPTEDEWESGERKIQCVVTSESGLDKPLL